MHVRTYQTYAELPAAADRLFAPLDADNLFLAREWLESADLSRLRPGDRLRLYALEDEPGGAPLALLPAQYSRLYGSHPGARVLHFMLPEERPYAPIVEGAGLPPATVAADLIAALRESPKAYDVLRISPLDPNSYFAREIVGALRASPHFLQIYRQPADCFVRVARFSFNEYMAARPRPLRESLERNTRLLMQGGRGRFFLVRTPEHVEDAWEAVRFLISVTPVDGEPEPPEYLRGIMDAAARADALRLGLLMLDDKPAAMQLWVISAGKAHCLRIWGGPSQRAFPLDDVLSQMMTLCLIDGDRVGELDFGAISEEFARDWAPQVRERIGIVAFNRSTWRGWRGALRHIGVQQVKSAPARLWRLLSRRLR